MERDYDLIIIGGGIVGLATALSTLNANPSLRVLVLEKEKKIGLHQTSRNSGVIHSGLYYKPGSLKAQNCIAGYHKMLEFCRRENIPHEICGKIVVAVRSDELPRLEELHRRGMANGLAGLKFLSAEEIREIEPHCAGVRGLFVPQTGIVDYRRVAERYAEKVLERGGEILCERLVIRAQKGPARITVETNREAFLARRLVTCGGVHSDRLAKLTNSAPDIRITPFRGEYFKLVSSAERLVRNLIYPVPDPAFPFLGVHFTRMIGGGVECGPNAVLAFAREGYRRADFNIRDAWDTLSWPGFHKIAKKYWRTGLNEFYRSFSKAAFVRALQQLVPEIQTKDVQVSPAGVRAQACSRDGGLVDDFSIVEDGPVVHVCNAPSPAATSSLAIGETIASRVIRTLS